MLGHLLDRARRVVGDDLVAALDHVERVHRLVVLAHIVEALGRAGVVVEGDARADHVEEGGAAMVDRRLDQRHQLLLVAGEARAPTKVAPSSSAIETRSIGWSVLPTPRFEVEPASAVAENWPLVRPYTPLFSTM